MGRKARQRRLEERLNGQGITFEESNSGRVTYSLPFGSAPGFIRDLELCTQHSDQLPRNEYHCSIKINGFSQEGLSKSARDKICSRITDLRKPILTELRSLREIPRKVEKWANPITALGVGALIYFGSPVCSWSMEVANRVNQVHDYLAVIGGATQLALSLGPPSIIGALLGVATGDFSSYWTQKYLSKRVANLDRKNELLRSASDLFNERGYSEITNLYDEE